MSEHRIAISSRTDFYPVEQSEMLVVLLHAFDQKPESLQRVAEVTREEYPGSDIYAPRLAFWPTSLADPEAIADGIVRYLATLPKIDSYRGIIFVGHSYGAVMARKVWALAHGATPDASIDSTRAHLWAGKIERIILLAAMNRGWTVSSALSPFDRFVWSFGATWGHICRHAFGRDPVIFGIRRGAPFLTTARLQCFAVGAALGERQPITVQLLGTSDDLVAPTDNLDLATGRNFYYVEIAEATHKGIIAFNGDGPTGARARFRLALRGSREELATIALTADDLHDLYDEASDDHDAVGAPLVDKKVDDVVFVIHGIRDRGFWTRRIAREVKLLARQQNKACRAVTSTYGFFPMGPFLLPWKRWSKTEWLLDQYVTARALYPKAKFSRIVPVPVEIGAAGAIG